MALGVNQWWSSWHNAEWKAFKSFNGHNGADVQFVVDGKCVYAHRGQLEKHSDVFKAMFVNDFENNDGKFVIDDVKFDHFEKLIYACYAPWIKLDTCSDALELFKLAHHYTIKHVRIYCENYISRNLIKLDATNVLEFFATGDSYASTMIKQAALSRLKTLDCDDPTKIKNMDEMTASQSQELLKAIWSYKKEPAPGPIRLGRKRDLRGRLGKCRMKSWSAKEGEKMQVVQLRKKVSQPCN